MIALKNLLLFNIKLTKEQLLQRENVLAGTNTSYDYETEKLEFRLRNYENLLNDVENYL